MEVVEVVRVEPAHVQAWADRLASDLAGELVDVGRHCPTCGSSAHGRPVVPGHPDAHVSLARAGEDAVVAVGAVPVGIDVEHEGSVSAETLAAADLRLEGDPTWSWVAAEARGKLAGVGLRSSAPAAVVARIEVAGLVVALATRDAVTVCVREEPGAPCV